MTAGGPSTQTDLPPIDEMTWDQLPHNFLEDGHFEWDPRAFFNDYMDAENANSAFEHVL